MTLIAAWSAVTRVITSTTPQHIVALAAEQRIVALAAKHRGDVVSVSEQLD